MGTGSIDHTRFTGNGAADGGGIYSDGTGLTVSLTRFDHDNAIFSAVLDAANECLGRFDGRPADDRWCDALLQVIHLGQLADLSVTPQGRRVS